MANHRLQRHWYPLPTSRPGTPDRRLTGALLACLIVGLTACDDTTSPGIAEIVLEATEANLTVGETATVEAALTERPTAGERAARWAMAPGLNSRARCPYPGISASYC